MAKSTLPKSPPARVTRGISIKEPWASLIVADASKLIGSGKPGRCTKPVENRTWQTSYVGPLAIQASSSRSDIESEDVENELCDLHPAIFAHFNQPGDEYLTVMFPGCMVGAVDCIGCVAFDPDRDDFEAICRAAGFGEWYDSHAIPPAAWASGPYCHLYTAPRQFTQPFPARGALNIYQLPPDQQAAIAKALAAPLGSPYDYRRKLRQAERKAKPARK